MSLGVDVREPPPAELAPPVVAPAFPNVVFGTQRRVGAGARTTSDADDALELDPRDGGSSRPPRFALAAGGCMEVARFSGCCLVRLPVPWFAIARPP